METTTGTTRVLGVTAATYTRGHTQAPKYDGLAQNAAFAAPTPDLEWACADQPPEWFQPATADALAKAKEVCASCVSRVECLNLGTQRKETGVWGGQLLAAGEPKTWQRPGRRKKQSKDVAA